MKKRVLVQESDEPDPETGEMRWVEEKDEGEGGEGEDEKIYIGKVRFDLYLCHIGKEVKRWKEEFRQLTLLLLFCYFVVSFRFGFRD